VGQLEFQFESAIGGAFTDSAKTLPLPYVSELVKRMTLKAMCSLRLVIPTLGVLISRVVFCGAEKQMFRITTQRGIASVQDMEGFGEYPKCQSVSNAVRAANVFENPIARTSFSAYPQMAVAIRPISFCSIDTRLKCIDKRSSKRLNVK
jgi:hypothetical protein